MKQAMDTRQQEQEQEAQGHRADADGGMVRGSIRELFWVFLRIGAFTFGGGYAMIPLIQKEVVEKKRWISEEDLLEVIAIAESTPGPIAVNAATFVGFRVAGFGGSFFATLGVTLPSFVIILVISRILKAFEQFRPVEYAFIGIRAAVLALIFSAFWKLFRDMKKSWFNLLVVAAVFAAVAFGNANVIGMLLAAGAAGLVYQSVRAGHSQGGDIG